MLEELRLAEAARHDSVLMKWPGGERTVSDFAAMVRRGHTWLTERGITAGDRVAIFAHNDDWIPALWYAIYSTGAIEVPINAHLRGPMLRHVLEDSDPVIVFADATTATQLNDLGTDLNVVVMNAKTRRTWDDAAESELGDPDPAILATIMYTSGTTGPSKGVMLPQGYYANLSTVWTKVVGLRPGDVSHFSLPMFHVDSHVTFATCLVSGSVFGFLHHFSASRFWQECEDLGATWFVGVGAMLAAISRQDAPEGLDIRIERGVGAPISDEAYAWIEDRLGIPMLQLYGQTEADGVTFETLEHRQRGSAGRPCTGFDLAIVDGQGQYLEPGEIGEIVYRPRHANMMLIGYWNRPDATVDATRDLWFHSGDLGVFDEDGFLWFKGRIRDSLRRRGENISAFELEGTIRDAPGIADCAAVAVPDPLGGEDQVKVFVILEDGATLDRTSFHEFCTKNLPRFAVPRYVQVVAEEQVVRGAGTSAIQKHLLPEDPGTKLIDLEDKNPS